MGRVPENSFMVLVAVGTGKRATDLINFSFRLDFRSKVDCRMRSPVDNHPNEKVSSNVDRKKYNQQKNWKCESGFYE